MSHLSGMQQISDYTRWSANTIRKLIETDNFPAVKIGGCWESDSRLIDKWRIWCVLKKYGATDKRIDFVRELLDVLREKN